MNARLINDPLVLSAMYSSGVTKKQQADLVAEAQISLKDKENRIHPFSLSELKEQLEDMEKQEEMQRRASRGKSIRMSSSNADQLSHDLG